ncbi:serine palmitoyltransferase 1-like [Tropilaelaps mercedesae]|uniref:Serine palmitoyltransferase 1 n=1 Tax=Tropilaelaps mercedesae TaxID=418985 RepID=A0A1V9XR54_9ACAR|nr:serine palmitoyltransferase 1-like [Tropilaelaps mercedesae]
MMMLQVIDVILQPFVASARSLLDSVVRKAVQTKWLTSDYLHTLWTAFPCLGPGRQCVLVGVIVIALSSWFCRNVVRRFSRRPQIDARELAVRIAAFRPDPLGGDVKVACDTTYALKPKLVSGRMGKWVTIDGDDKLLNLASHNYLGLANGPEPTEKAKAAVRAYGVGTGGPKMFFGTFDIYLTLETKLAEFMQVEAASFHAQGFVMMLYLPMTYIRSRDVVFADECVHFAIQEGLKATSCICYYFRHNDAADLQRLLEQQNYRDRRRGSAPSRRFIVIEGIYQNNGQLVRLEPIVHLRSKYKCRLFVDESVSLGVLGETGRGIFEHFAISRDEGDLISASLEYGIGGHGSFVCGSRFIVDRPQPPSLIDECCGLPPLQAVTSLENLEKLTAEPERVRELRRVCSDIHRKLQCVKGLHLVGDELSPIKYLLFMRELNFEKYSHVGQDIVDNVVRYAASRKVALTPARHINEKERNIYDPAIRLALNCQMTVEEIDRVVEVLQDACKTYVT